MEIVTPAGNAAAHSSPIVPIADGARAFSQSLPALTARERLAAYYDLTKPRITFLVVLSSLAGFTLGSPSPINWLLFLHTTLGIALLSSGISTLNQYWERDLDALMERTRTRSLPAGKLPAGGALVFGIALSVVAEIYLAWLVNPLTAACGLIALASYLFVYTPLKTRTHWCTFIGAIPGALPPLLGWAAARNQVSIEAWTLFGILFFWQFPHFHAIATMYREDYGRARIRMLPVVEPDGRSTARQIVGYTIGLVIISLLPVLLGLSGRVYLAGAVLLGAWFLHASLTTARQMTQSQARRLLKVSVIYLPLLLGLMVLNR